MTGSATILSVANLRVMLDPQTYYTDRTREYWRQCGHAAMAALRTCCNLSPLEMSYLRRDNFMPDGATIVQIRDTFQPRDRDIPVIVAAQLVVARFLEATPKKFRNSRYLFVTGKGTRHDRSNIMMILNLAARRAGVCDNFMEASEATFVNAVYCDPLEDGVSLVLTCRSLVSANITLRPEIDRLRSCLEEYHPLRDLNQISFFERPLPKLAEDIRACKEPRTLGESERQMLRRQVFPEAVKLFDEGFVAQDAVGRYFGLDPNQIYKWFKRYRLKGREGLVGRKTGCRLTPEWCRKTMELYAKMSPIMSWLAFHRHIENIHRFPYSYTALCDFLKDAGEIAPKKERMTKEWRDLIDHEFVKFECPPPKKEFWIYLRKTLGFHYCEATLCNYLDITGLLPKRRAA